MAPQKHAKCAFLNLRNLQIDESCILAFKIGAWCESEIARLKALAVLGAVETPEIG